MRLGGGADHARTMAAVGAGGADHDARPLARRGGRATSTWRESECLPEDLARRAPRRVLDDEPETPGSDSGWRAPVVAHAPQNSCVVASMPMRGAARSGVADEPEKWRSRDGPRRAALRNGPAGRRETRCRGGVCAHTKRIVGPRCPSAVDRGRCMRCRPILRIGRSCARLSLRRPPTVVFVTGTHRAAKRRPIRERNGELILLRSS